MNNNNNYYLVHKDALPDFFELVLQAKHAVEDGESVSSVCKRLDISRSTFYKYKDLIFETNELPYLKALLKVTFSANCLKDINAYFGEKEIILKSIQKIDSYFVIYIEYDALKQNISQILQELCEIEAIDSVENIGE